MKIPTTEQQNDDETAWSERYTGLVMSHPFSHLEASCQDSAVFHSVSFFPLNFPFQSSSMDILEAKWDWLHGQWVRL